MDIEETAKELKRIEEDSTYSSKGHFVVAQVWSKVHLVLGLPAAALGSVAGATFLTDSTTGVEVKGLMAVASGALVTVMTFLNASDKASSHYNSGNAFTTLRNDARSYRVTGIHQAATDVEAWDTLQVFNDRRNGLNETSLQIPRWAFKIARKGIEEDGEADYRVDKE